jgi:hypothetical protein
LIEEGDIPVLLDELDSASTADAREAIGFLATTLLAGYGAPWADMGVIERVFRAAEVHPTFSAVLAPLLNPIELNSEIARGQRLQYEASNRANETEQAAQTTPNLDDLMPAVKRRG